MRLAAILALAAAMPAVPGVDARAADRCAVEEATLLHSPHPLSRVARHVGAGAPIRIVALGSSSTEGVGASSPDNAYPAQLERELRRLLPRNPIAVQNKGVGGQEARDMLARLQRDALDEKADLVIWQSGTNGAISGQDVGPFVEDLFDGIRRLQAAGIDVLLMGPQKSPRVDEARARTVYDAHLLAVAGTARVPYLARYEIMAGWIAQGRMTMAEMIDPDGLHMTDLSYGCLGRATARMIVNLSRTAVARRAGGM
jgi:lysophospholipase L1-like esterase